MNHHHKKGRRAARRSWGVGSGRVCGGGGVKGNKEETDQYWIKKKIQFVLVFLSPHVSCLAESEMTSRESVVEGTSSAAGSLTHPLSVWLVHTDSNTDTFYPHSSTVLAQLTGYCVRLSDLKEVVTCRFVCTCKYTYFLHVYSLFSAYRNLSAHLQIHFYIYTCCKNSQILIHIQIYRSQYTFSLFDTYTIAEKKLQICLTCLFLYF